MSREMPFDAGTWTCHICKDERPDTFISVHRKPLVGANGVPSRVISENVRYCNDRPSCKQAAKTFSFVRNWGN